jgi:hypothetical protein
MYQSFVHLLALVAVVTARSIVIDVGKQGSLTFSPSSIIANIGDT